MNRLREFREARNLSRSDLAKRAGFAPSWVAHVENGGRDPSLKNAIRLADALGVSLDALTGRLSPTRADVIDAEWREKLRRLAAE